MMIRKLAFVAVALAGPHLMWPDATWKNNAAAAHGEPAVSVQTVQAGGPGRGEDDDFLALLEENVSSGGPPKDGIPAVDTPQYMPAAEADAWLAAEDVIFGVDYDGFVAAYPQRILVWHEIVNETIGDENVSITYCPLTGTAIGFKGTLTAAQSSTFGVSGKLVNSNLIMYDRATDSHWPQILGKAITGPLRAARLEEFPVVWTTWEKWRQKHPETKVLSQKTGFIRNYGKNGDPYGSYLDPDRGYYASEQLLFRPLVEDRQLHPKSVVAGVRDGVGNAAAVLKERLRQDKDVALELGNRTVVITYDPVLDFYSAKFEDTEESINAFDAMWFAWKAFYPETDLLR